MRLTAIIVLVAAAALLMLYPLWGLLHPESYGAVLAAEFEITGNIAPDLVRRCAAMNWAPNGILASSFVCLAGFITRPDRSIHAQWAGGCLITYPLARSVTDALSGLNLTSHAAEPAFALFLGGENLVYMVFGLAVLSLAAAVAHPEKTAH